MSFDDSKQKILATIILEILGKPPEHLTETLKSIIKQMGEEKGVNVKAQKINNPYLVKEQKDFYTTFAEIDIETRGIEEIVMILFKYMPSHIEIIQPESIKMPSCDWNETLNEITRRLHAYDEVARIIQNERIILEQKLKEIIDEKKEKGKKEDGKY